MAEVNWEWIILIIIVGLIFFAGMGIFVGTRISSDRRRIRELEDELTDTKRDLEAYRSRVNSHFKKTSELFSEMTDSYRAIYMHLAQGSQDLCTTDAALLKPANEEFLKVTHEVKEESTGKEAAEKVDEKTAPPAEKPVTKQEAQETGGIPTDDESGKNDNTEEKQATSDEQENKPAGEDVGMKKEENRNQPVNGEEEEQAPGTVG